MVLDFFVSPCAFHRAIDGLKKETGIKGGRGRRKKVQLWIRRKLFGSQPHRERIHDLEARYSVEFMVSTMSFDRMRDVLLHECTFVDSTMICCFHEISSSSIVHFIRHNDNNDKHVDEIYYAIQSKITDLLKTQLRPEKFERSENLNSSLCKKLRNIRRQYTNVMS